MIPFLKNKHEGAASGPVETIERERDDDKPYAMLDAIVEDLIEGLHSKSKALVRGALEALVEHIKGEDEIQDEEEFKHT